MKRNQASIPCSFFCLLRTEERKKNPAMEIRIREKRATGPPAGVVGIFAEAIFPAYGLADAFWRIGAGGNIFSDVEDPPPEETLPFVTEIGTVSFL